jgi:hypothetical protein
VLERSRALTVLQEDRAYLRAVREHGAEAELPARRRNPAQRRLHSENVAALAL